MKGTSFPCCMFLSILFSQFMLLSLPDSLPSELDFLKENSCLSLHSYHLAQYLTQCRASANVRI